MDWSAPHAGFVAAAYGLSGAVLLALVVWTVARRRRLAARQRNTDQPGQSR